MTDEATAFVPGHITGFFSAHPHENPAIAGSRGAGVALSHGVRVTVRRTDDDAVPTDSGPTNDTKESNSGVNHPDGTTLNGDTISMPPVDTVRRSLDVSGAEVHAETQLPLGSGFGVSGAMALGTAYAANAVFDAEHSENELVTVAHRAEVEAGTGLGDVVAQARGGLPIRLEPGAPGHGTMDGVPGCPRVEYLTFGEVSTAEVLSGDTTTLTAAGERSLADLRERPTADRFLSLSRRFAREADLTTDRVESVIADVRAAGGDASMAMLGETVFAFGTALSDAGYDPEVCDVHPAGSSLVVE
ncbi:sugar kinase [Halogeometricum borinquense]|uniref:Pantoate kinase n=1 Tax=Halogeometricum borinquense TaxID=60847 RepID=A0A6C0UD87_9EURY|nr:pantoate kinase [Halogeometricum borinquense]QIB73306.1 sugar kinase [Halogeometricum borinquense]QIQ77295.1 sugar kinase [Halogeometricum borinquense]